MVYLLQVVRTARRRQMLMDVLTGGIARQRIIDAAADFTATTVRSASTAVKQCWMDQCKRPSNSRCSAQRT